MLIIWDIFLLAGLVFLIHQYRKLEKKHEQLLAEHKEMTFDHGECIKTVEQLTEQLEGYAGRVDKMHRDSHAFFKKLLSVVMRLPRYKIPDREKNHHANHVRKGLVELLAIPASADPDEEPDEIDQDLCADVEKAKAWLAVQRVGSHDGQ